ncbi:MAG: cobalamin-independent methionine synthase II family protein [Steroidobacteraceae bacterium]
MRRSVDRILTTHVGSITRPADLLEASGGGANTGRGPEDWPRYEQILRRSIAEVVRQQAQAGIDIVNDGEFGKSSWAGYIIARLGGFEVRPQQLRPIEWLGRDMERFREFIEAEMPRAKIGAPTEACVGPIRYQDRRQLDLAIDALKATAGTPGVTEYFMTAVAPASTAFDGVNEYYATEREYVYAIADALRVEYQAIHAAGFLVQVDDAVLANMYDTLVQKSPQHYRKWAELRVEALNHALEGIPEDRIRYHVCFGSWHLPHTADAPLEDIIDLVLQVKTGAYSIEAANPRHEHEWRVWEQRRLPNDRILIPGVITHHVVTVEHPRLVADRIVRFAKLVGRENVIAGTDCGFAQVDFVRRTHPSVMWAKFEALAEGARIATRELWGR